MDLFRIDQQLWPRWGIHTSCVPNDSEGLDIEEAANKKNGARFQEAPNPDLPNGMFGSPSSRCTRSGECFVVCADRSFTKLHAELLSRMVSIALLRFV
jgi:hypothetical protein